MYHLRHRYPLPEGAASCSPRTREAVEEARRRLDENSQGLTFDAPTHTYYLDGRELRNVSSIVHHFAPFDSDKVALGCSRNPKSKYFGMTPEEIKATWAHDADLGTQVHAFAEACCLWCQGRGDAIEPEYRDRISPEGLKACTPKEAAAAMWWDGIDLSRYAVVAKETRIVNRSLGYAGTFDLLLFDSLTERFCIRDYKTNGDLLGKGSGHLKAPLTNITNNDIGRYTVQQSLYMIELENLGLPIADMSLVWLREGSCQEVELSLAYANQIYLAVQKMQLTKQ